MLSVAIVIQACQLLQLVSSKLCIETAVNSDCISCVINRDPRASGGEICISNIFKVGTELKTYFRGKKFVALRSVMPRSDIGGSTVLLYCLDMS